MNQDERTYCLHLLHYFKLDGKHADEVVTDGQLEIFYCIVFRPYLRLQILCSTQYGKSLFVALACIIVACIQNEIIAIIAPTDEKAKIIMRYFVEHLGDDPIFYKQLEKKSKLDRLRMEDTKERIIMRKGGGIFMISVQAGNSKKGIEAAMGAGAKNVIQDESGLIPDPIESTVYRMIAGKGEEAFYCKIGNPFYRNHFLTSWNDPSYHKVFIDYKRAMVEGRYNAAFVKEARKKPNFSILYECKFPGEGMVDATGYLTLVPENKVIVRPKMGQTIWVGRKILAVDPAGNGKDAATWAVRDRFKSEIVDEIRKDEENHIDVTPKVIAERTINIAKALKIAPEDIVVDAMGVGSDVGKEIAIATADEPGGPWNVYTVLVGNHPLDEVGYNGHLFRVHDDELINPDDLPGVYVDLYLNLRALMFFRMQRWVIAGGQLIDEDVNNSPFKNECCVIKYKYSLQRTKIQLMPKEEMRKLGIPSPNRADALALTFLRDIEEPIQSAAEVSRIKQEEESYDPHSAL